jgi:hypothetical protein
MVTSVIAKNSASAIRAPKSKEVPLPVYADDLLANVREGFEKTNVYIKNCMDALNES